MRERTETAVALERFLVRRGIKGFVFDVDDFVLDTTSVFTAGVRTFARRVAESDLHLPVGDVERIVWQADRRAYAEFGVDPVKRWDRTAELVADVLGERARPIVARHRPVFDNIYRAIPPLLPGAMETVATCRQALPRFAFNTLARGDWTRFKLRMNALFGLATYVHIVPIESLRKDARDWEAAARGLGLRTEEVLGAGDSLIADVLPAIEAGVRPEHVCWVPSWWGSHTSGALAVPKGVLSIAGIRNLIPTLLSLGST